LQSLKNRTCVWFIPEQISFTRECENRWLALLDENERRRISEYRFEQDRRLFLQSRVMVRNLLSRFVDVAPSEWRFVAGDKGRPEIAGPAHSPLLRF